MEFADSFLRLGIALGLGLLVGLQRERSGSPLAGFRTFPLVTLCGVISGFLAQSFGGWIIAGGLLALSILIAIGYRELKMEPQTAVDKPGLTTEVAMLLMFAVGAYLAGGELAVAVTVGGTAAVLLHFKLQMHSIARRLADPDFQAIMQFVLITLVILPILPNRTFGPYQVLNPFRIWLMVVLIVGISLSGLLIQKFLGSRAGILAGGILGGLVSSTATTVSYSRRSKENPDYARTAAMVIMLASAIVFVRILIIIGATSPDFLSAAAAPIGLVLVGLIILSGLIWRPKESEKSSAQLRNPSQMKAALIFAFLYALILLGTAAAKDYFGTQGLYIASIISGLTDMDAITLSITQMVGSGSVKAPQGWRLILIAALANIIFKTFLVGFLGSRKLLIQMLLLFAVSFAFALAVLLLWPN